MVEIYNIKETFLLIPINFMYSIFFLLFIIIIYFIYIFILKNNNKKILSKEDKPLIIKKIDFIKILDNFEKTYIEKEKWEFYSKLLEILREVYKYKNKQDIWKLTFDEINKLGLDQNLKDLIKNIYFKEYSRLIDDNDEIRRKLISEVKGMC